MILNLRTSTKTFLTADMVGRVSYSPPSAKAGLKGGAKPCPMDGITLSKSAGIMPWIWSPEKSSGSAQIIAIDGFLPDSTDAAVLAGSITRKVN
ncbi:MAG: hypothetical protein ABJL72_14695 [Roseobacter sp.]